jgi:hypothetical protein
MDTKEHDEQEAGKRKERNEKKKEGRKTRKQKKGRSNLNDLFEVSIGGRFGDQEIVEICGKQTIQMSEIDCNRSLIRREKRGWK